MTVFFFQAEDGIRDLTVTGVQTCALPIWRQRDLVLQVQGPREVAVECAAAQGAAAVERGHGQHGVPEVHIGQGAAAEGQRILVLLAQLHARSEEHTSELQSQSNLVCRLLLEKKKKI